MRPGGGKARIAPEAARFEDHRKGALTLKVLVGELCAINTLAAGSLVSTMKKTRRFIIDCLSLSVG